MRPPFSLLILTLAVAACPLGAQEDMFRIAPLESAQVQAQPSPGTVASNIISAQSAQEFGISATAVGLYREALQQAQNAAERRRVTMALTTALLDNGELAEAEKALLLPELPHDSAWNLRAGLVQIQKRTQAGAVLAGGHLRDIRLQDLVPEDVGWWYLLQGRIADAQGESPRAQGFYEQAIAAADKISVAMRTRFQIYREEVFLRTGPVTDTYVEQLRLQAQQARGTANGPDLTIIHASALNEFGQRTQAIKILQDQLASLPPAQRAARDKTLLLLGLIATTKTDSGREALLQLLTDGADRDRQRQALLLLANEPQATDFRRRLDTLIARPEPHPILEDLLMKRAQLAAAEKTPGGYTRAKDDANELLASFPGSDLKAPALALLASLEWEQKRYTGAADYAAQAWTAAKDPAARARLGLLEAEALFRASKNPLDYRRAAAAYDPVLLEPPVDVPLGDLLFQRLQAEIAATDFSDATASAEAIAVLDRLAANPLFDVTNRWEAEWNLARKLRASNQTDVAYQRVNGLLGSTATVLPSPDLRAQMAWFQAQLSLEAGQPQTTIRLTEALAGSLPNVTAALAEEIRSATVLLKGQAEIALGREKEALDTFARLQRDYKASAAAASSIFVLAEYFTSKDRIDDAQKLLRGMPESFPNSPYVPQALYNAALLDATRGRFKEAANRLDTLAHDYPNEPLVFDARLNQAYFLNEDKDFGHALQLYQNLTKNYPNDPRVHDAEMGLADCYKALATTDANSAELAAVAYERLLEVQDVRLDLRVIAGFKLGLIYSDRGQLEKAQQVWWREVVTAFLLDPKYAGKLGSSGPYWMGRTLNYLADSYITQNRPDDARKVRELLVQRGLPGKEAAARLLASP